MSKITINPPEGGPSSPETPSLNLIQGVPLLIESATWEAYALAVVGGASRGKRKPRGGSHRQDGGQARQVSEQRGSSGRPGAWGRHRQVLAGGLIGGRLPCKLENVED